MLAKANFARPLLAWSLEGAHSPSSAGSSQDLQLGIISRPTNRVLCQISPVLGFHLKVQQRASCLTGSGNLTFMTWWFAKFCSHQCCSTEALYAKIYCNVPNSPWSKYDKWVRIWTSAQKEHLLKRKYELRFFHLRFLLSFFMTCKTHIPLQRSLYNPCLHLFASGISGIFTYHGFAEGYISWTLAIRKGRKCPRVGLVARETRKPMLATF